MRVSYKAIKLLELFIEWLGKCYLLVREECRRSVVFECVGVGRRTTVMLASSCILRSICECFADALLLLTHTFACFVHRPRMHWSRGGEKR